MRRCLRQREWKPYQRAPRVDTLLATHAEYLRGRAAEVGYSAQVLFQELRRREYCGSYETDFGDRVIASAILDRILHHATTICIRGDSYRLKDKLKSGVVKPTTAGA